MTFYYGSVCSGIEAATVAWHDLGWQPAWFAEIEKFPCAVLAHHYPNVPNLGDMTKIRDRVISGEVAAPDVLVGGTPCQAFSVAGLRNSLGDDRGLLTLEYVRLADAIDSARLVYGKQPAVIVWENVPGALSTKDNAFGCFLGALAGSGCALQPPRGKWGNAGYIAGPQRQVAWRVLDAQYFGLAQRRKRMFVVASAMARFDPAEILLERNSVSGNTTQGRNTEQDIAGTLEASIGSSRGAGTSPAILTVQQSYRMLGFGHYVQDNQASTILSRDYKYATDLIVSTAKLANSGEKKWSGNQEVFSGDFHVVHGTQDPITSQNIAHPLGRNSGQENVLCYGIPGNWIGRKPENGGNAVQPSVNISPCLTKTDRHGIAAFHQNDDGSQSALLVRTQMKVRRFVPVECERLQGFPDCYTQIPYNGKPAELCPDGPRYAALGNSMAVPVMRWIGERIAQYLQMLSMSKKEPANA